MLELDNESKIIKNYLWLKIYVLGCLLGWMDGKFAAKKVSLFFRFYAVR